MCSPHPPTLGFSHLSVARGGSNPLWTNQQVGKGHLPAELFFVALLGLNPPEKSAEHCGFSWSLTRLSKCGLNFIHLQVPVLNVSQPYTEPLLGIKHHPDPRDPRGIAKQLSILVGLRIQSNLMEHLRDGRPVLPGIQPRSGTQM